MPHHGRWRRRLCNDASCLHRTKNFGHFGRSFPGTHSTMIVIRRVGGRGAMVGRNFPTTNIRRRSPSPSIKCTRASRTRHQMSLTTKLCVKPIVGQLDKVTSTHIFHGAVPSAFHPAGLESLSSTDSRATHACVLVL